MFALQDIEVRYPPEQRLTLPDWAAPQGGQRLLTGPSGSGKSTLLHLLAGVLRPARGRVQVADTELGALGPAELDRFRGRHIGLVFQRLHLIGALTVLENLLLAQRLAGLASDRRRACDVLAALGIEALAGTRPARLSVGQAQRAAIARAVVNRPRLLLADEPTSALDDEACAAVLALLMEHSRRNGATLLIATHDARLREHIADRLELARPA